MSPEETTVQVLILWALALSTVINLGTVVWNIFSGPSKKNGARLDALTAEMTARGAAPDLDGAIAPKPAVKG